ncbi:hypothetical protein SVI_1317 [Shewanella violacea DSS12]|uniref:Uncharacterized protein n=1 Tax=Shewanella violacea (strain JCM 10179 / CIP 106290 / LMG 19151 / DSS12) TaxID=637905 RepID=D4ZHY9_SHEVD|nr:hypothetical protein SVI_1317 [Shewanella violacea DSS12]
MITKMVRLVAFERYLDKHTSFTIFNVILSKSLTMMPKARRKNRQVKKPT